MFIIVPACHPGLLFQGFPVAIPRVYISLLSFDPYSIVTGDIVFIFGPFEKATLQRNTGETKINI